MEENYKLLATVLKELQRAGALQHLILAGSWCQYFYRILFAGADEIPLLRTTDIDFLIPNPPKVKQPVDVSKILMNWGLMSILIIRPALQNMCILILKFNF